MAEEEKKTQEEEKLTPAEREKKLAMTAAEVSSRGAIELYEPIKDGDREYTRLEYDFKALRGTEMADALDSDDGGRGDVFRLSRRQAIALFAAAAEKKTDGLFAKEIKERLGVVDALNAVRIASLFFLSTSRAGNYLISNLSSSSQK